MPLPNSIHPPPFLDAPEAKVETDLEGVIFIPLNDSLHPPEDGRKNPVDSIAMAMIYRDSRDW